MKNPYLDPIIIPPISPAEGIYTTLAPVKFKIAIPPGKLPGTTVRAVKKNAIKRTIKIPQKSSFLNGVARFEIVRAGLPGLVARTQEPATKYKI